MLMPGFLLCFCRNSLLTDLLVLGDLVFGLVLHLFVLEGEGTGGGGHLVLAVEVLGGLFLFIVLGNFLAK